MEDNLPASISCPPPAVTPQEGAVRTVIDHLGPQQVATSDLSSETEAILKTPRV